MPERLINFMDVLYILLPISVALAFVIALVFLLSVRSGQFDDLEGPAYRVLDDDDTAPSRSIQCKPRGEQQSEID